MKNLCANRGGGCSDEVDDYSIRHLHNSQIIRLIIRKTGRKKAEFNNLTV